MGQQTSAQNVTAVEMGAICCIAMRYLTYRFAADGGPCGISPADQETPSTGDSFH